MHTYLKLCLFALASILIECLCGVPAFAQTEAAANDYISAQPNVTTITATDEKKMIGAELDATCKPKREAANIRAQKQYVRRDGSSLVIDIPGKTPVTLKDFAHPGQSELDGDSQNFCYDKRVAKGAYHKVDVFYKQSRPVHLLINASSGQVFYVDYEGC